MKSSGSSAATAAMNSQPIRPVPTKPIRIVTEVFQPYWVDSTPVMYAPMPMDAPWDTDIRPP